MQQTFPTSQIHIPFTAPLQIEPQFTAKQMVNQLKTVKNKSSNIVKMLSDQLNTFMKKDQQHPEANLKGNVNIKDYRGMVPSHRLLHQFRNLQCLEPRNSIGECFNGLEEILRDGITKRLEEENLEEYKKEYEEQHEFLNTNRNKQQYLLKGKVQNWPERYELMDTANAVNTIGGFEKTLLENEMRKGFSAPDQLTLKQKLEKLKQKRKSFT